MGESIGQFLKSGNRVYVGGSINEPTGLIEQLKTEPLPANLEFIQFPIPGFNQVDFTALEPSATFTTCFITNHLKNADSSRLNFLPMQMRRFYDYLQADIDVFLLQIARDQTGKLRVGPNVDFYQAAMKSAKVVIAELNNSFVAPLTTPLVDESRIDCIVESNRPLFEMPPSDPDAVSIKIGENVAALIKDGDCLQTGIGAIPAAILSALNEKNDLGMHGGLIDDGGMNLITRGNINGSRKAIDTGQHIAGMALGSRQLLEWAAVEPRLRFMGADHTHEVSVIGQLSNFVSVNSAVEVDLFGQVNAEYAGGRQISGTGGSVDFMRSAAVSHGGRSIVAMNATARGGSVSRIVPSVELVTALRTDVHIVVTEYGAADIRYLSNAARADALINIAAPAFREELRRLCQ